MTDDSTQRRMSRRGVLRRGAVTAGALTLGAAGFSGSVLASYCLRTPGYWVNHDWCEAPVNPEGTGTVWECLGGTCPSAEGTCEVARREEHCHAWKTFLTAPVRGDKAEIMGKTVLAAQLNLCRLPPDCEKDDAADCDVEGSCVYEKLDLSEFGITEEMNVAEVETAAVEWLEDSTWGEEGTQDSWTAGGVDCEPYKDVLDAFNSGRVNASDCFCGDADGE